MHAARHPTLSELCKNTAKKIESAQHPRTSAVVANARQFLFRNVNTRIISAAALIDSDDSQMLLVFVLGAIDYVIRGPANNDEEQVT